MYIPFKNQFDLEKHEWEKAFGKKIRNQQERDKDWAGNDNSTTSPVTSNKQNNVKSYLFVKSFKHFRNSKYAKNAIIFKWNNKQVVLLQPDSSMAYNSCCRLYHEKSKWRKEKSKFHGSFHLLRTVVYIYLVFRLHFECIDLHSFANEHCACKWNCPGSS